ncbi:DNA topoisomerase IV subunit A [Desulfogranum japonicum]|uniref:DNA topoisomerase IV subunit A n=1 Tax=Desulfogranum japonicum TaxID=231447 RepID=UPI0004078C63|nr:DNA topoisomerase IV subunit A [Desulfogranum japonicum]
MSETSTERQHGKLHQLFDGNFLEYTSYVIRERAIPDVDDGLKPVQRRILQTLHNMDDGRYHKVANVVGETMKLHPHGDQSIFAALVNLANKGFLIDRQGNFGNIYTGDQASAARYIECRLSPLARETLFNKELTEFIDSYDGRMQEPVTLPVKIPLLLLMGAEGIAVGMATKIMPHNFNELLQAQIDYLQNKEFTLYPDFPKGGLLDVSDYDHGNGRIRCRARLEMPDDKTILITEIPYNITTQGLIDSVERAAKAGKLKIASINDYTAEKVEVEIKLSRGVHADETIDALYAFTDCEISISPSLVTIVNNMPQQMQVEDVLKRNTDMLLENLRKELELELGKLQEKWHARKLEQIFIEERIYKKIEEQTKYQDVVKAVDEGLKPFADELKRAVSKEDIERLLEIKIRRISRYDINKQQKELREIEKNIRSVKNKLKDMVGFTIGYISDIKEKYGEAHPRISELNTLNEVDARSAALANLQLVYQSGTGFIGHKLKVEDPQNDLEISCSEYDRVLLIFKSGLYKVINVQEKIFVGSELLYMDLVDPEVTFNIIYRNGLENMCYVKRFATPKFILNREYHLFEEHNRSAILFLKTGNDEIRARINLVPSSRAKYNSLDIDFSDYMIKGAAAKGKRISTRVVRRVSDATGKPVQQEPVIPELPGFQNYPSENDKK